MIVSPDEGAMNRNMYYSSVLGCNLGMFYKRRDYSRSGQRPQPHRCPRVPGRARWRVRTSSSPTTSLPPATVHAGYCLDELKKRNAGRIFTCSHLLASLPTALENFDRGLPRAACIAGCAGHQPDLPQARAAGPRVVLRRRRFQVYRLLHRRHQPRQERFFHHRSDDQDTHPAGQARHPHGRPAVSAYFVRSKKGFVACGCAMLLYPSFGYTPSQKAHFRA